MTLYSCGAHIDENGRATGGKRGDQTGREVSSVEYYDYPWSYVLRYCGAKPKTVRNRIMQTAWILAKKNKVGYSQSDRDSLFDAMRARKFSMKKLLTIPKCNTDCSAFVGVVVSCALVPIGLYTFVPSDIWTGNEYEYLTKRGFKKVKKSIDFETGEGLMPGDILVNPLYHTEIFMGSKKSGKLYSVVSKTEPTKTEITEAELEKVANRVIDGEFGNGSERVDALKAAGYDPVKVQEKVNEICSRYGL